MGKKRHSIGKFSVAQRLKLMVAVPVVTALLLGILIAGYLYNRASDMTATVPLVQIAESTSALVHELQKERGRSAAFVSSGREARFLADLQAQRSLTDAALADFDAHMSGLDVEALFGNQAAQYANAGTAVHDTLEMRGAINSGEVQAQEIVGAYSARIDTLIRLMVVATEHSPSQEVKAHLSPYIALVRVKESAGLERALGSALLNQAADGAFSDQLFVTYSRHLFGESIFLDEFQLYASDSFVAWFDQTVVGPDVEQVMAWRDVIAAIPETVDAQGVDGKVWFDTATKRINLIKQVEDRIAAEMATLAAENEQWAWIELAIGIAVIVSMAVGMIIFTINQTRRTLYAVDFVSDKLMRLANGDLDVDIEERRSKPRKDEVSHMYAGLVLMKQNALEQRRLQAEKLSNAEREAERTRQSKAIIDAFQQDISELVAQLTSAANDLNTRAGQLTEGAEATTRSSVEASSKAELSSNAVESMAAATEEITASIGEVNRQASGLRKSSQEAADDTIAIHRDVAELKEKGQQINGVMTLISDIAAQTNLLALNATIEAARAGAAGKGFAVVASEVKALSNETAKATESIRAQVEAMVAAIESSTTGIEKVSSGIESVGLSVEAVATAVDEQLSATSEISQNAAEASKGSRGACEHAQQVQEIATRTNENAADVRSIAEGLAQRIGSLQTRTEEFVSKLAAA